LNWPPLAFVPADDGRLFGYAFMDGPRMARCRNLKPSFFTNELLGELPALTRLLFEGLWCYADREGRLEDRPKRLKMQILPYDDHDVDAALAALASGDDPFLIRYEVNGGRYIQIVKFLDNQTPHYTEKPSVIPAPPNYSESTPGVQLPPIKVGGSEVRGSRKGDARGKPKQISAASVPVPPEFETPEVRQAISDWLDFKVKRGEPYKDAAYFGRKVAEFSRAGPRAFIAAVNSSIGNNYAGLFLPRGFNGQQQQQSRVGPGQRYRGPAKP
jgi:hypothetical protein